MSVSKFERIGRALSGSSARRHALQASLGGVLAATAARLVDDADAKPESAKKKHGGQQTCRKLTQSCKTLAACSGAELGVVACRAYLPDKQNCPSDFPGLRCCGLEGVVCDPNQGNCSCCDDLVCTFADGAFRCEPSEP